MTCKSEVFLRGKAEAIESSCQVDGVVPLITSMKSTARPTTEE